MITVVTGPPCSGKSTYVRTNAQPGDIVIDFDTIAQALGSPSPHDHATPTRHVTIMARRAAITAAITVHEQANVWIVETRVAPEHMTVYHGAGAQVITLHADADELHRRAGAERPPLWHKLIDQWQPTVTEEGSEDW